MSSSKFKVETVPDEEKSRANSNEIQSPTNLYNEFTGFNNFLLATTHNSNTGSFTRAKLKKIQEDNKDDKKDDLGENRKFTTSMQHHRPTLGNYKAKPTPRQTIQELMFGEENEPLKPENNENDVNSQEIESHP